MFKLENDIEELKKEFQSRKEVYEKKSNLTQEQASADIAADSSWEPDGENSRGKKLKKKLPKEWIFENEVWSFFYHLGCDYLSTGGPNKYLFEYTKKNGDKHKEQLDVVAIKDRYVFICEVTAAKQRKPYGQSQKKKIDAKLANRVEIEKEILKLKPDALIYWIYATKDYKWSENYFEVAKKDKYVPFRYEEEMEYFFGRVKDNKTFAKNSLLAMSPITAFSQFLSMPSMDSRQGNENSDFELKDIPAHKVKLGDSTAYICTVNPSDIFYLTSVGHHVSRKVFSEKFYQRFAKVSRVNEIAQYINNRNHFPNNILTSIKIKPKEEATKEKGLVRLSIKGFPGCINIIDGQHRVFGYAAAAEPRRKKDKIILTIYKDLTLDQEMQMFVDVNSNQAPVDTNLINSLLAQLPDPEKDVSLLLTQECSRVVDSLASTGFLKDYITEVEQPSKGKDQIKRAPLTDTIKASGLFKTLSKDKKSLNDGILYSVNDPIKKFTQVINLYFKDIQDQAPDYWKTKSLYNNRESIRALILLLRDILLFVSSNPKIKIDTNKSSQKIYDEYIEPWFKPVKDYILNTKSTTQYNFMPESDITGQKRLTEFQNRYRWLIKQKYKSFPCQWNPKTPSGNNKQPAYLLEVMQKFIFEKLNLIMTKNYPDPVGNNHWWDAEMKKKYNKEWNEAETLHKERVDSASSDEPYEGLQWQMLSMFDVHKIITKKKFSQAEKDFKEFFACGFCIEKDSNGVKRVVEKNHQNTSSKVFDWLQDLGHIRNHASHGGNKLQTHETNLLYELNDFFDAKS